MKIVSKALLLAGIAALAACNKNNSATENAADNVVENAENYQDTLQNEATQVTNNAENKAEALENAGDNAVDAAKNQADAMKDAAKKK